MREGEDSVEEGECKGGCFYARKKEFAIFLFFVGDEGRR